MPILLVRFETLSRDRTYGRALEITTFLIDFERARGPCRFDMVTVVQVSGRLFFIPITYAASFSSPFSVIYPKLCLAPYPRGDRTMETERISQCAEKGWKGSRIWRRTLAYAIGQIHSQLQMVIMHHEMPFLCPSVSRCTLRMSRHDGANAAAK